MRTTRLLFLSFSSVLGFLVITLRNLLPPQVLQGLRVVAWVTEGWDDGNVPRRSKNGTGGNYSNSPAHFRHNRRHTKHTDAFSGGA